MRAGSYKVLLRVVDGRAYAAAEGHEPTFQTKTVERHFDNADEVDNLFQLWAAKGISAKLGRYVGF